MAYKTDFRPIERMEMAASGGWFVVVQDQVDGEVKIGPYATAAEACKVHGEQVVQAYFGK